MEIDVLGHSGCSVKIVYSDKELLIEKSTKDIKYFDRLISQAEKQKEAKFTNTSHIKVPEIYKIEKKKNQVTILMKYIYSKNFINFFETSGFDQITTFSQTIINFIEEEILRSPITVISSNIVKYKFNDICNRCRTNTHISDNVEIHNLLMECEKEFYNLDYLILPIGVCHGDLTFSNILFGESDYYLIDFLDSFIESPLMDVIKIRQDSKYMWSKFMYIGKFDDIRLKMISEKIDKIFDEHFSRYQWYITYYKQLQLMNFLRILQYAYDDKIIEYLINVIKSILNELNSTCCSK